MYNIVEMDEKVDFDKVTNQSSAEESPSSILRNNQTDMGITQNNSKKNPTVTRIVYGADVAKIGKEFALNCTNEFAACCDHNGPSTVLNVIEFYNIYSILKSNSVKIKLVTEVTRDNLRICDQIIKEFDAEIRHLPDTKGNFGISDNKEYVAAAKIDEKEVVRELIYSNAKEIVEQNRFIFETLWKKAIPVEQRRTELENGKLPLETNMIDNPTDALNYAIDFVNRIEGGLSNFTSIDFFKLLDRNKPLLQAYLNLLSRNGHGIRWLTSIENNKDIDLVKKFLNMGIKIRHTRHLPQLNFAVSEKQFVGTVERVTEGKMFEKILHSTDPLYMNHFQSVFEELWIEGKDAKERIIQIESGIDFGTTRVIEQPIEAKKIFLDLLKNAQQEIMILFPSYNAIKREVVMGVIDALKQKSAENIRIRILSPVDEKIKVLLFSNDNTNNLDLIKQNISCKEIRKQDYLISTIVIVDRKYVLATELRDDSKELFEKAIGLVTYSISKPTVLSYISIFESLWDQTELSTNLKVANERLVHSEQIEREFINTAAHELRTPTQAIMGYAELGEEVINDLLNITKVTADDELKSIVNHLKVHFDALSRNSVRLDNLINNLLDVARIDSNRKNSLFIQLEKLDLVKEINDSIRTELGQKIKDKNIEITFLNDSLGEQCLVYADKLRLGQIINNLIGNAIKFTNRNGRIDIIIEGNISKSKENEKHGDYGLKLKYNSFEPKEDDELREDHNTGRKEEVFVSISDNGKGISSEILPKLFEKFVTGSDTGTGLGLYITRNLVEAHGGRIWAYNNNDGVGSTFVFSLPKADGGEGN